MAISGTLQIHAPDTLVAYELLQRFGLGSEVETHGADAPIDLRIAIQSADELRDLVAELYQAMTDLELPTLSLTLHERTVTLER